jgi:hypothetical protein
MKPAIAGNFALCFYFTEVCVMQRPEAMSERDLFVELCGKAERLDALEPEFTVCHHHDNLSGRANALRAELLSRMSGGQIDPDDEQLLQELLNTVVDSVNSGETEPAQIRRRRERLTAMVFEKARQGKLAMQLV